MIKSICPNSLFSSGLSIATRHGVTSIPDFLLPCFKQPGLSFPQRSIQTASQILPLGKKEHGSRALRHFSSSTWRRAVSVTANPRQDEAGNEMMVDITPRAAKV